MTQRHKGSEKCMYVCTYVYMYVSRQTKYTKFASDYHCNFPPCSFVFLPKVSGKVEHRQDADTNSEANSDTDLNISFCRADLFL